MLSGFIAGETTTGLDVATNQPNIGFSVSKTSNSFDQMIIGMVELFSIRLGMGLLLNNF
jgi:hypothetical protein